MRGCRTDRCICREGGVIWNRNILLMKEQMISKIESTQTLPSTTVALPVLETLLRNSGCMRVMSAVLRLGDGPRLLGQRKACWDV